MKVRSLSGGFEGVPFGLPLSHYMYMAIISPHLASLWVWKRRLVPFYWGTTTLFLVGRYILPNWSPPARQEAGSPQEALWKGNSVPASLTGVLFPPSLLPEI